MNLLFLASLEMTSGRDFLREHQYSMTKTGIKNEHPTSNIELPTSNYGTPSAFQFY